jgi:hypothetical protein
MRLTPILTMILVAAACGGGSETPDATVDAFVPRPGRVRARWSIRDVNGPTTCEAVGATNVVLRLTLPSGEEDYDIFMCNAYEGVSSERDPNVYYGTLLLVDNYGGLYDGTLESNVVVPADGSIVDMEAVEFMVEEPGGFDLTIDSGFLGGNCVDTDSLGAGITGVTYNILNVNSQCVTRDLEVSDGPTSGRMGGTYGTECVVDEPTAPCVENDQVISLGALPPGSYNFTAIAWFGDIECFDGRAHIDIGPGETVHVGTITYMRRPNAACPIP